MILVTILWEELMNLTWRPYVVTRTFRKQGVSGPRYRFWHGNLEEIRILKKEAREIELDIGSHDIVPKVLPHYYKWMHEYGMFSAELEKLWNLGISDKHSCFVFTAGGTFLYWLGSKPRLCITDAEHAKQVLSNKFGFYVKGKVRGPFLDLLGKGLVLTNGSEWARHRRIVSPAFTMDKLKVSFPCFKILSGYGTS